VDDFGTGVLGATKSDVGSGVDVVLGATFSAVSVALPFCSPLLYLKCLPLTPNVPFFSRSKGAIELMFLIHPFSLSTQQHTTKKVQNVSLSGGSARAP
jgi:hypothetical protein